MFIRVSTTASGSCFYLSNSNVFISKCSFVNCFAHNNNGNYGNAFLCESSTNVLRYVSSLLCAPATTETGDSSVALIQSTGVDVQFLNSSKCHGTDGAASITYRQSISEVNNLSYITVVDPEEHSAFESSKTKTSYLSFANFINTKNCIYRIFQNPETEHMTLSHSYFINPHQSLFISIRC